MQFAARLVGLKTSDKSHYFRVHFRVKIEYYRFRKRVFGVQPVKKAGHIFYAVIFRDAVVTGIESEFFKHYRIVVTHRAYVNFGRKTLFRIQLHKEISEVSLERFSLFFGKSFALSAF